MRYAQERANGKVPDDSPTFGNVTDMQFLFANNTSFATFDLNGWDAGNAAFAGVTQTGTWVDKSGITSPAWNGSTSDLAAHRRRRPSRSVRRGRIRSDFPATGGRARLRAALKARKRYLSSYNPS